MNLNDPQSRMSVLFPEYEHEPPSSFQDVLGVLASKARSSSEKGRVFEALVKAFIELDKGQSQQFDKVWLWSEYPKRGNRQDTGIDLVARERKGGGLVAIQAKFYAPDARISLSELNKFLGAYSTDEFAGGVFVSTTADWSGNAENALRDRESKPIVRWGPDVFEDSSIDWEDFSLARPRALSRKTEKSLREYQQLALEDVIKGFGEHERGKLIMACGSGKTFTALRIAEKVAGAGGSVLFLTPSISLLSQSLRDWANDAAVPVNPFAVCSDAGASRLRNDGEDYADLSPFDLPLPASTDAATLAARYRYAERDSAMSVVFSTYQSLDAVSAAQGMGLPKFDLIICDEAHRTTGATLAGEAESNFRRVHDNGFIAGEKRLYMTATPRIYGDAVKRRASDDGRITLSSMDDESLYGPEFHRLGFGKAVEMEILSNYKVLIFDVDLQQVGMDLDKLLSESKSELNMDNGARMVGCWNGLRKRGAAGVDFGRDARPVKRAVAFSNTIAQSEAFEEYFPQVIESCIAADEGESDPEGNLRCEVRHVDGTQSAMARANSLAWLREDPDGGRARILTNARCLTEGIDVPALDAIMFLHPRRSEIDVVQAVGRVMRKSKGKDYGYIILPIARAPGASPQDAVNDGAYRAVWQVINAIAAHDDRFEAKVNQLKLVADTKTPRPVYPIVTDIDVIPGDEDDDPEQIELPFIISGSSEFRDAILATVVDKYSNPRYWERWADTVREIAERHEARVRALLAAPGSGVRTEFDRFLRSLRSNLNDGVTEDEAIGMLSQHLVSKPVFDALFDGYDFAERNPVSLAMQGVIDALQDRGLEKETEGLERFYRDVRIRAEGVTTASGKQRIIAELYDRFLTNALPDTARNLGIVYTPVDAVDYVIRSVEDVLNAEFGASLGDEGVHVIDPFAGTGTFITRMIQSGIIGQDALRRKYADGEIHANEIVPLAYWIASVNIEAAYRDAAGVVDCEPFGGGVLTDTFQAYERGAPMHDALFGTNSARIERQKNLPIQVVIGNPPWSAMNNRAYPGIDGRVRETYTKRTSRKKVALYDPYVRAIRLASDWVQGHPEGGVVAFVTNGGFIDANSFDGFRKTIVDEFDSIYCYNLRGNQRTSGELSRKEGGKLFGSGSRAGVAILILVKHAARRSRQAEPPGGAARRSRQAEPPGGAARRSRQAEPPGRNIHYMDIGDLLTREQKLEILADGRLATTNWQTIAPDANGDWIAQRNAAFATFRPLSPIDASGDGANAPAPIFLQQTLGLVTSRDVWAFASSTQELRRNVNRSVAFYNMKVAEFQRTNPSGNATQRSTKAKAFIGKTPLDFHWGRENYRDAATGKRYEVDESGFRVSAYRPFFKQRLYFSRELNNSIRDFPRIYPSADAENLGISFSGPGGSNSLFHALMTDCISEYGLTPSASVYIPRWRYQPSPTLRRSSAPRLERVSNINPQALSEFRAHYGDRRISEDDLFHYVYGVLHSPQYREAFANDLAKSQARMPMAASRADFRAFADAGRQLADLHVNYESVKPHPLEEIRAPGWNPRARDAFRVQKMKYRGKLGNQDKTRIEYNAGVTLAGIPDKAHEYRLGSRSALDWLIERYQVRTHKASGITNDPNDWAAEVGDPRYILDLVRRVTTLSVRTVEIVAGLPELPLSV